MLAPMTMAWLPWKRPGGGPGGENWVHVSCSFAVLLNAEGARLGRRGQAVMSGELLNGEEKVRRRA